MSPTKKDFEHLVAFLLRQLDPHWRLLGKLEDEVPAMLAWLKYPFQVRGDDASTACIRSCARSRTCVAGKLRGSLVTHIAREPHHDRLFTADYCRAVYSLCLLT